MEPKTPIETTAMDVDARAAIGWAPPQLPVDPFGVPYRPVGPPAYPWFPTPIVPPPRNASAFSAAAGSMYVFSMLIGIVLLRDALEIFEMVQAGSAFTVAGVDFLKLVPGFAVYWVIMCVLGIMGSAMAAFSCFARKRHKVALIGGVLAFVGLHVGFGLVGFVLIVVAKPDFT